MHIRLNLKVINPNYPVVSIQKILQNTKLTSAMMILNSGLPLVY